MTANLDRMRQDPGFKELFKLARHRNLPKNYVVIREKTLPGQLYLIMSGQVAVRYSGPQATELLLGYLYPGDFFGEMCLFPGVSERSAMITTAADCSLLEIDYKPFVELTQRHPSLWLELAGQLAARLRATNRRLAEAPALHAADRVWGVISEIASNMGAMDAPRDKAIRITRQDLGKLAGCSRELAGMVLRDFARAGRISLSGRAIVVPRPGPAKRCLNEDRPIHALVSLPQALPA